MTAITSFSDLPHRYDAQIVCYALYVGQQEFARQIIKEAATARIAKQIEPDGRMPRELARTRSLHYTAFNLQAFITLARAADQAGANLWDYTTEDGRCIKSAIAWYLPYLRKEKSWPYEQITPFPATTFARYLYLANLHYQEPNMLKTAKDFLQPIR